MLSDCQNRLDFALACMLYLPCKHLSSWGPHSRVTKFSNGFSVVMETLQSTGLPSWGSLQRFTEHCFLGLSSRSDICFGELFCNPCLIKMSQLTFVGVVVLPGLP